MAVLDTTTEVIPGIGNSAGCLSADDITELGRINTRSQAAVEEALGWPIEQATYTEYYPIAPDVVREGQETLEVEGGSAYFARGDGGTVLSLRNRPVRSITSVTIDTNGFFGQVSGSFAGSALVAGSDYYLTLDYRGLSRSGALVRRGPAWPAIPGSIKVVYVAGFSSAELLATYSFFKDAVLRTIRDHWNRYLQMKAGLAGKELNSESLPGGVSGSYSTENTGQWPIPDSAMELIDRWISYSGLRL